MILEPYEINAIRRKDVTSRWRGNVVLRNGWCYCFHVSKLKRTLKVGTYLLMRDGYLSNMSTGNFVMLCDTIFCETEVPNFYA